MLGYSGWTIHLPQALAGVASVALLYGLVRRPFGIAAASSRPAAGPDAGRGRDRPLQQHRFLAGLLPAAGGAAALRGRGLSLVMAMALLGVAFNVKMLAALICGPALLAGWWWAGTLDLRRRLGWMVAAGATLAVVSLSWSVAFDLTPRASRPYAGSTEGNSMLELVVVHNGLERFVRLRPDDRGLLQPKQAHAQPAPAYEAYDSVPVGPLRLAAPQLAAQFAWLLPLALVGLFLVRRRDRIDASLALWGVWLFTYGIVFSAAGGIFHATISPRWPRRSPPSPDWAR